MLHFYFGAKWSVYVGSVYRQQLWANAYEIAIFMHVNGHVVRRNIAENDASHVARRNKSEKQKKRGPYGNEQRFHGGDHQEHPGH